MDDIVEVRLQEMSCLSGCMKLFVEKCRDIFEIILGNDKWTRYLDEIYPEDLYPDGWQIELLAELYCSRESYMEDHLGRNWEELYNTDHVKAWASITKSNPMGLPTQSVYPDNGKSKIMEEMVFQSNKEDNKF